MKTRLILGLVAAVAIPAVYADSINIKSSTSVTFLPDGPSTTPDFPAAFTTGSFISAQIGANAVVLTVPFYTTALTTAGAEWIGTNAGGGNGSSAGYTALYAICFTIPDAFVSGSLTLNYAVDNEFGDVNPGVYLNGQALRGTTGIPGATTASFAAPQTYTDSNVGADLVQGTNWLYIDTVNRGAEGGLIFSANISTVNSASAVPEPASVILMFTMLLGTAYLMRKPVARRTA